MLNRKIKKITAFVGHYGSGKSEIAINYAMRLREKHDKVTIVDLDVVNPYYRTKNVKDQLEALKINVIAPAYSNTNADMPTISADVYSIFENNDTFSVLDIGGDDSGAIVLGSYFGRYTVDDYDLFCVINQRRPMTATPEQAVSYIRDIEAVSRMKVTGLINNTNISYETTPQIVIDSVDYAKKVSELTGIEIVMTTALERIASEIGNKIPNLVPIKINIKYPWLD